MDLVKTKKILEIMKGVGIEEAGIFVADSGDNQIRGISPDMMIIMYTDVEQFIESPVGILNVNGLLSRLNLFDEEKMGVDLKTKESREGGNYVNQIVVKEGRRRSTVTTTDPNMMGKIPSQYPDADAVFSAVFTKEYVDYLNKMKTSIKTSASTEKLYAEMYFDPETPQGTVAFSIGGGYDDFDDRVEAELDEDQTYKAFSVQWDIDAFIKAMKQAATVVENDDFIVSVNSLGLLEIDAEGTTVTVSPLNVHQQE